MWIRAEACKCDRCGHVWLPEKGPPRCCAKCKSPKWDGGEKKDKEPKAVRTTGKNQKLKKKIEAVQVKAAKKAKAGAASKPARAGEQGRSARLGHEASDCKAPLDGGSPPNSPDAAPAPSLEVSRECSLGAHAGCKGCSCACHAK